jgi:hypothetical protein
MLEDSGMLTDRPVGSQALSSSVHNAELANGRGGTAQ